MCGIAGIWTASDPSDKQTEVERALASMRARGPDGEGVWRTADGSVVLGHRRLAILDLSSAGAQPMVDPATGNVIVFNGEIYNFRTLQKELKAAGKVFQSNTDTEVLLHLYAQHGEAMVERLEGMFAFAIWDNGRRRLFLARDHLGIKPLYYSHDGKTLRFASQVKALLAGGRIANAPSAAGMAGFWLWGHVPEPWTSVDSVKALPAGCTLTLGAATTHPLPRRYFDLREQILAAEQSAAPRGDAVEHAVAAVEESIARHLVSDVPVGAFLSAGRDSTLVAAVATRHSSEPLRTITLGFDEYRGTGDDEVPVAEAVAALLGSRHATCRIERQDFATARDEILAAMDQPSIDGVNTWLVSRAAAQAGLKVALSGLGGDELFGGYSSFAQVPKLARTMRIFGNLPTLGRALRIAAAPVCRRTMSPKWASIAEYGGTLHGAWFLRRAFHLPWEFSSVMAPSQAREGLATLGVEEDLHSRIDGIRNPQLAVMALEMGGYMRNQLLRDADWAGMAHSLEIRVPLVDVELLRRWLPVAAHSFPMQRQRLLEKFHRDIARIVGERPKSGFSVPVETWQPSRTLQNSRARGRRPWSHAVATQFYPESARLRVAFFVTDAYGGIGGIAKFNREFAQSIAAMPEVDHVIVTPRLIQRQPEPTPNKVQFDRTAAGSKFRYGIKTLQLAFARTPLDLVVCGHINLFPLAWLTSAIHRTPLALVVHGIEIWKPHKSNLVRMLLRRADTIISVSRFTQQELSSWSSIPSSRVRILPNCVDLATFKPQARNVALADRLGLRGRRVLLTVGRMASLERNKGFDEVLEVLPRLVADTPSLVYVVVGSGDDRARLEAKAVSLGVRDHVVFTGFLSEAEKIDMYNLADVHVMPSRGEGFGIVHLEAMACGIPTIGSRVDGSRDALCNGVLGAVVDPASAEELRTAIRAALEAPRGRPGGLQHFSSEAYMVRTAELVRSLVNSRT